MFKLNKNKWKLKILPAEFFLRSTCALLYHGAQNFNTLFLNTVGRKLQLSPWLL
jgi:hypothetical protein